MERTPDPRSVAGLSETSPIVRYAGSPIEVRFLCRPNRYLAVVEDAGSGRVFSAHVPNPGRMEELLVPGLTTGFVVPVGGSHRKTHHDLVSVRHGRTLVSVDSRVANRLVAKALRLDLLPQFGQGAWTPEVGLGHHRIDFGCRTPAGGFARLLEVKSSNLRVGRTAMFPDAPTVRGAAHVDLLRRAHRRGVRCGVLFVVQRPDVDRFAPNNALDPRFGRALAAAIRSGVRIAAYTTSVRPGTVQWGRSIPVVVPVGERI